MHGHLFPRRRAGGALGRSDPGHRLAPGARRASGPIGQGRRRARAWRGAVVPVKAVVTGAGGQLAKAWSAAAPPGWTVTSLTRAELDIGEAAAVERGIGAPAPALVLNAAAYTAVARAESGPAPP